jgi:hypothetical protein
MSILKTILQSIEYMEFKVLNKIKEKTQAQKLKR